MFSFFTFGVAANQEAERVQFFGHRHEAWIGGSSRGGLASNGVFWLIGVSCGGCCRRRAEMGRAAARSASDVDSSAGR